MVRETHAKNMVMDGDVSVVETGARTDFYRLHRTSPHTLLYTLIAFSMTGTR